MKTEPAKPPQTEWDRVAATSRRFRTATKISVPFPDLCLTRLAPHRGERTGLPGTATPATVAIFRRSDLDARDRPYTFPQQAG